MNAAEWLGFTLGAVLVGESGNQYVFYKGEVQLNVDHGDWIIKYEDGSIAVCGDERFHVYYERIVN